MPKPKSIEEYISKHPNWEKSLNHLHSIISQTELEEAIKWNMPVYTIGGKNVVGLSAFKNHFGLWFYIMGLSLMTLTAISTMPRKEKPKPCVN